MYSLTSANRYYLYQGFVRMNLGIDGLFKIIRSQMKELSPISGDIFLFFGKNRQSVKILHRKIGSNYQRLAYIINDYQGVHFERLSF
jgi:hypothetical protein